MKIGFAARYDPLDKKTWSGTAWHSLQQVSRFGEIEIFQFRMPKLLQEWLTTRKSINRRWRGYATSVEFLRDYATYFSRKLSRELRKRPVDLLFVSASSQLIAYADIPVPVIYMTDATFQQLQGYYPGFSHLGPRNIREGIQLDRQAFEQAAHCMLASDWCRASALHDYGIPSSKISVVPCGANLDRIPSRGELQMERAPEGRILFLGVDWERKGGPLAWDAFCRIREEIPGARLTIAGCVPPAAVASAPGVDCIPFLDKNKPEEAHRLHTLLLASDLLLLPTRAECAGIVFCEASAYGLPIISTDTGGVSSYVKEGVNGYLLPPEAPGPEYAARILSLLKDQEVYRTMRSGSRTWYETSLNWEQWGRAFGAIADGLLKKGASIA